MDGIHGIDDLKWNSSFFEWKFRDCKKNGQNPWIDVLKHNLKFEMDIPFSINNIK